MRVVVVGPGALGCLFAGLLSKKAEVWLLDKDPKRAKRIIKNQGISSQGVSGKWQANIPATARASDIGVADLVILCVKAYNTKDAIVHAKDTIGKDTVVLTLQNGLGNLEVIAEVVGGDNVLAGTTYHGATLLDEGKIVHHAVGQTIVGSFDKKVPIVARKVREIFNKAGIDTKVSQDIKSLIWSKLIINIGINALSAIMRLKNGQLLDSDYTSDIMESAVTEAVKVAKKKRVKLIYDDPLSKVAAVCRATSNNASSMLQDVLAKKKTEIDFLNGVIVRQGKSAGIATPVNFMLLNIVKGIESHYHESVS